MRLLLALLLADAADLATTLFGRSRGVAELNPLGSLLLGLPLALVVAVKLGLPGAVGASLLRWFGPRGRQTVRAAAVALAAVAAWNLLQVALG